MARAAQHGFHIKRPADHTGQPVDPAFDEFGGWAAGRDARAPGTWALYLPHQCDEWAIGSGTCDEVLAAAKQFRAELDEAIAVLEDAVDH